MEMPTYLHPSASTSKRPALDQRDETSWLATAPIQMIPSSIPRQFVENQQSTTFKVPQMSLRSSSPLPDSDIPSTPPPRLSSRIQSRASTPIPPRGSSIARPAIGSNIFRPSSLLHSDEPLPDFSDAGDEPVDAGPSSTGRAMGSFADTHRALHAERSRNGPTPSPPSSSYGGRRGDGGGRGGGAPGGGGRRPGRGSPDDDDDDDNSYDGDNNENEAAEAEDEDDAGYGRRFRHSSPTYSEIPMWENPNPVLLDPALDRDAYEVSLTWPLTEELANDPKWLHRMQNRIDSEYRALSNYHDSVRTELNSVLSEVLIVEAELDLEKQQINQMLHDIGMIAGERVREHLIALAFDENPGEQVEQLFNSSVWRGEFKRRKPVCINGRYDSSHPDNANRSDVGSPTNRKRPRDEGDDNANDSSSSSSDSDNSDDPGRPAKRLRDLNFADPFGGLRKPTAAELAAVVAAGPKLTLRPLSRQNAVELQIGRDIEERDPLVDHRGAGRIRTYFTIPAERSPPPRTRDDPPQVFFPRPRNSQGPSGSTTRTRSAPANTNVAGPSRVFTATATGNAAENVARANVDARRSNVNVNNAPVASNNNAPVQAGPPDVAPRDSDDGWSGWTSYLPWNRSSNNAEPPASTSAATGKGKAKASVAEESDDDKDEVENRRGHHGNWGISLLAGTSMFPAIQAAAAAEANPAQTSYEGIRSPPDQSRFEREQAALFPPPAERSQDPIT